MIKVSNLTEGSFFPSVFVQQCMFALSAGDRSKVGDVCRARLQPVSTAARQRAGGSQGKAFSFNVLLMRSGGSNTGPNEAMLLTQKKKYSQMHF